MYYIVFIKQYKGGEVNKLSDIIWEAKLTLTLS
jgi:hypothetical protein